jgi:hypothetical protein
MSRDTFVLQVHPGGVSTLETVRTRERVRIEGLDSVGAQVERWISDASAQRAPKPVSSDPEPRSR